MNKELEFEIRQIIRDELENHLEIDVESYYEPYSGQAEHCHKVYMRFNNEST